MILNYVPYSIVFLSLSSTLCNFLYDFGFYIKEGLKEELILYITKNSFTDIFEDST